MCTIHCLQLIIWTDEDVFVTSSCEVQCSKTWDLPTVARPRPRPHPHPHGAASPRERVRRSDQHSRSTSPPFPSPGDESDLLAIGIENEQVAGEASDAGESFTGLQPLQVQTTQGSRSSCQSKDETLKQLFTRNHFFILWEAKWKWDPTWSWSFSAAAKFISSRAVASGTWIIPWVRYHIIIKSSSNNHWIVIKSSSNHHHIIFKSSSNNHWIVIKSSPYISSSDHLLPSIVHPGGHIDSVPPDVVKWFLSADHPRNHFPCGDPNPEMISFQICF